MKTYLLLLFFLSTLIVNAQTEYFTITSQTLQSKREVKVQLPRTYNSDKDQTYPLIFVFNGDYLFEPIAGTVDYLSYWDEIPEAIIVGINQEKNKKDDFKIGKEKFLPVRTGADFFDFIELELMQTLNDNYRISNFKVAVGHGASGNFINFFLLRETLLFQGFINLSPLFSEKMPERISNALARKEGQHFYYTAVADKDYKSVITKSASLGDTLAKIQKNNVDIRYDTISKSTHYSMVTRAIPKAIEHIFSTYSPVTPESYEEDLLKGDDIIGYLEQKYYDIEKLYGLEIPVRINDIIFAGKAIEDKETWQAYKDLSNMASTHHPNKILGSYYLARYYEKTGNPKKAIKYYTSAYSYKPVGKITKDFVLDKAEELKKLFGY